MLAELRLKPGVYNSLTLNYKILSIDDDRSIQLNLKFRFTMLVRFQDYDEVDDERRQLPFASIFKTNDEVPQDSTNIPFIESHRAILVE